MQQNMMDAAFERASEEMASRVPKKDLEFQDYFDLRAYAKAKAGFDLGEDCHTVDHKAWQVIYLFWDEKLEKILGAEKKARLDELIGLDDGLPVVTADVRAGLGL
jgi:hypothetical protein